MIHLQVRMVFLMLSCSILIGCGSNDIQQPTYPASGEVKLDGRPVKGATVVFHAVDKSKFKWHELPQATTDANGKFSLFTYTTNDGAPAAEYRVGIAMLQATDDEGGDQAKRDKGISKIPTKYGDASTSGLTAAVTSKATIFPVFELSSK